MKLSTQKKRAILFAGIALLSVLFSACPYAVSKHPLSQPGEQKNDERLTGTWYLENEDERVYIHVAQTGEGGMAAVMVELKGKGERGLGMEACTGFTSQLDQQRFLNISQCVEIRLSVGEYGVKKISDEDAPYLIVLYKLNSAGELTFQGISEKFVKASILAGRLEGSVEDGVKITASTPDLIEFIKKSDPDKLFYKSKAEDKNIFRKLVIPSN